MIPTLRSMSMIVGPTTDTNVSWTLTVLSLACSLAGVMGFKSPRSVSWTRTVLLLACTLVGVMGLKSHSIPPDCSTENQTLDCAYSIPQQVLSNITAVYIRAYNKKYLAGINNDHYEWKHVIELDITIDKRVFWYSSFDNVFRTLNNLKTLGIHGRHIFELGNNAFAGLDNLNRLDLSGCMYLPLHDKILPSITSVPLPMLSSLSLAGVETVNSNQLVINNTVIDIFIEKAITHLNLSNTNIMLKDLNFSKSLLVTHLDISNTTLMAIGQMKWNIGKLFSNLKTLIYNDNARYNMFPIHLINLRVTGCLDVFVLRNVKLENLYANKASTNVILVKNSTIDFTKCPMPIFGSLKRVHMQYNHIETFDGILKLPENNIEEVDFSHNDIKFISPIFTKDAYSLKYFSLAYNNLHHMENKMEFVDLLKYFISLEEFSIAHNHLTFVPHEMFSNNRKLKLLDLSGNSLETVDFRMNHLTNLSVINLRRNRIKSLPEQFRSSITAWLHPKNTDTNTKNTGTYTDSTSTNTEKKTINLEDNDLECSCDTKDFVTWMLEYIQPSAKLPYSCRVDGDVKEINKDILDEIDYLCIRTVVITSSVTSSCILVALITSGIIYIIRKMHKKRRQDLRQRYLDDFRDGTLFHEKHKVKYVAFLAHSSAELELVTRVIYDQLNDTFQEITGVNHDIVCMGDRHFEPGFSIIEQTMQCLEQSCAAIVIVSESFCRSQWCEMELKEAYQLQKPIVLIFTDKIDETLMSPIMLNIFRRQTRATLYNHDGQYVLEPSWNVLCEAVVTLACMPHQYDRGEAEARDEEVVYRRDGD